MKDEKIEAIIDLQEYIGSGEYNGDCPPIYLQTARISIQAIEKRIPQKPFEPEENSFNCPICWSTQIDNFCARCGQAIDWETV